MHFVGACLQAILPAPAVNTLNRLQAGSSLAEQRLFVGACLQAISPAPADNTLNRLQAGSYLTAH